MRHLALFTSALTGGGIQRSMVNLALGLAEAGHRVELVVCHDHPPTAIRLRQAGVRVVVLESSGPLSGRALALRADPGAWRVLGPTVLWPATTWSKIRYLAALRDYLRQHAPDGLIGAMTQCNLIAVWARRLAGVDCRLLVSERNMLSRFAHSKARRSRWRHARALVARTYVQADAIVAVSDAVAADLAQCTGLARDRIRPIANPVVDRQLRTERDAACTHPWFNEPTPVVLCVGRLVEQKDPVTLIRAFADLRSTRPARLVFIGDGPLRQSLATLATELGVANDIDWLGWIDSPFAYMTRADVLVLASRWEGLPGVLIQALACGCPVVATDAPGGSSEILGNGQWGRLVPVGDASTMSQAIAATLDTPPDRETRRLRAEDFSVEKAIEAYLAALFSST